MKSHPDLDEKHGRREVWMSNDGASIIDPEAGA
jgi:hypothetical protein